MPILISDLEVLHCIEEELNLLTDPAVVRYGSKLEPIKEATETAVGTIHNNTTKRLYCAFTRLRSCASDLANKSCHSETNEEEHLLARESHKANEIADLTRAIFWAQVREEMGHWEGPVGVRLNWMAVTWNDEEQNIGAAIAKRLFGM